MSVRIRLPVMVPEACGANSTPRTQSAPGFSVSTADVLQVVSAPPSEKPVGVVIAEIVNAADPIFITETSCAGLDEPIGVEEKESDGASKRSILRIRPFPESAT